MTSSSSSTVGLTTPPPSIEFNPPTYVAANSTVIEPTKQPITIFDPSEWIIHIQSCITKMREDLGHRDGLSPQIIQTHNAFADKLDEAYDILQSDTADTNERIRNRNISIIDSSSKLSADLYTNLVSIRRRVGNKLKMLAILQECQQETAAALKRFMSFIDKGKGTTRSTTPVTTATTTHGTSPGPATAASTGNTHGGWISAERFLDELRPLLLGRRETARRPAMKAPDAFDGTYSKLRPWSSVKSCFWSSSAANQILEFFSRSHSMLRRDPRRARCDRGHGVRGGGASEGWWSRLVEGCAKIAHTQE